MGRETEGMVRRERGGWRAQQSRAGLGRTARTFFFDQPLQTPVHGLAGQLAGEHEGDLGFAAGPNQSGIDDAETLGNESQPCTQVREAVIGILWISWSARAVSGQRRGEGCGSHNGRE